MPATHVLVVDSERHRALAVADRARSKGWDVLIAIGTDEALHRVESEPIAVLLADASVWSDSGLAAALREAHPSLPVVVLSTDTQGRDEIVQQLELGAMTYVPRNADGRRLVETISGIVELTNRSPHRERVRDYLIAGEIEIQITNDVALVAPIVEYLQRILEDYGLTEQRERSRVGLALSEAVTNAIVHGNLGISSALREGGADEYYRAIAERRARSPFRDRAVHIVMRFSQSSATFVVRDHGEGFDRASLVDPTQPEHLTSVGGRGILLMRAYCDAVSWNEAGNEVTLVKTLRV